MTDFTEEEFSNIYNVILNVDKVNFNILSVVLKKGDQSNLSIRRWINQPNQSGKTALCSLMQSNHIEDISEEYGADPLTEGLLPIHLVSGIRQAFDSGERTFDGFSGTQAKERLTQYLKGLKDYGIQRLFEENNYYFSEVLQITFVKSHLVPAICDNDYAMVDELFQTFYTFPDAIQKEILHQPQEPFGETPLFWATRYQQETIMHDVVKAEFRLYRNYPERGMKWFEKLPSDHQLRNQF